MPSTYSLEEQISALGLQYGRRHDISYRIGLILQVVGAAVLALLYPLQNPFYSVGIMLFEVGVLLSSVFFLIWISWIKKIILSLVLMGLSIQILGIFVISEQYAGLMIIFGIGLVCAGAAGIAGKEAYCFGFREGWILMIFVFPMIVLANLFFKENRIYNSLGFAIIFILLLTLTGKILNHHLLSQSTIDTCRKPSPNRP